MELGAIFVFMLVLMRITGLMLFVPLFAHSSIPVIARVGFASAFALMVFPMVEFEYVLPNSLGLLILWMAKELIVGLCMGLAVRMLFFMLDLAAHVLTVEIGLMPGAEFNPSSGGFNPLGSIMYFFGMMLFLMGSEYDILRTYINSYQVAPIGYLGVNAYSAETIVLRSVGVFKIGILIAAPVIAVNFLVNLVFAVLGKAVPKLNVFILSFSVRIICGTTVLAFSIVLIVQYVMNYLHETPEMMLRFIPFRPSF
ncbi:flagellar biosynthetic protein FliR [Puniceicoccaceae bacterium K14]|nr:flagellar biosynthetic protein FliR [Puniceicoccaceae bacterium K14]